MKKWRNLFAAVLAAACAAMLPVMPQAKEAAFSTAPMLAAGGTYSLTLKRDGTVWAWGSNERVKPQDGSQASSLAPTQVPGLTKVIAVATGGFHALALKSDGTVWAWGDNSRGALGDGTASDRQIPVQVRGLTNAAAVAAGESCSLALKKDGTVWAWGDYAGDGSGGDLPLPQNKVPAQMQAEQLKDIAAIAASHYHCLAVQKNGAVWGWGSHISNTQALQNQNFGNASAIAVGLGLSLALRNDNTVWAWGSNRFGQLGNASTADSAAPVQVQGLYDASAIAAGASHALALNSGTVWAWGYNGYGQLGDGTTANRSAPVQLQGLGGVTGIATGSVHSLALKSDGTVWAWGWGSCGQLGDGSTAESRSTPVQAADAKDTSGFFNVLRTTNTVKMIFDTSYEATFWNWVKYIVFFGWIWMR